MKIYYEPINLLEWNMFKKISGIGHIEGLLATKSMECGDIILLHAGKQNRKYKSGIYSIGEIVTAPFIFNEQIDCHCYNRLTVNVKIIKMNYTTPIISYEEFQRFNKQFRTVHLIEEQYYDEIINLINREN